MSLRALQEFLVRFIAKLKGQDAQIQFTPALSDQSRLLARLNCIDLDKNEARNLQPYLENSLEARHQNQNSNLASSAQFSSDCIVVEMTSDKFQDFAKQIGGNGIRLFRALVQSDNSYTPERKLTLIGENGLIYSIC